MLLHITCLVQKNPGAFFWLVQFIWVLMMQDDIRHICPINELSVSLYDLMFISLRLFVNSQCVHKPNQN